MIKLPNIVRVGGFDLKVYFPYNFDDMNMGEKDLGLFEPSALKIKVQGYDTGGVLYPNSIILQTFLHEIFHAIDLIYCYDKINSLDDTFFGEDSEEVSIPSLSVGWYQVLKDNNLLTLKTIPKKVRVGAYTYDIIYPYDKEGEDAFNLHGIAYVKNQIKIRGLHTHGLKYDFQRIQQILLYCVTLVVIDNYACWIPDNDDIFSSFSFGLYQVLKDNSIEKLIHKYK